jgi:hypothetical protein
MLFQRVNRTDAEKVFVVVYNASGGAFTLGQAMQWDVGTSADGIRVTTPATAGLSAFAGLAAAGIANGAYGLAQVYGYTASASVVNDITTALVAGNILLPVNGTANLSCAASGGVDDSDGKSGFIIAMQTNTTATAGAITATAHKAFIRAL